MRSSRVNCSLTAEFALIQETILIQNERISQLYVIQSEQNPFLWFGVLFVDQSIYKGSVIRFTIFIEETYPDCACPKVVFDPIPPHPLVNPFTGELDTKNAFPDWSSTSKRLLELLLFVKRTISRAEEYIAQIRTILDSNHLKHDNPSKVIGEHSQPTPARSGSPQLQASSSNVSNDVANDIASNSATEKDSESTRYCHSSDYDPSIIKLFTWFHHTLEFFNIYDNQPDEFHRRMRSFRERCNHRLFDRPALCGDDRNAIVFSPWDSKIHEPLRDCVLAGRFTPTSLFASYHKETDSVSFIPGHDNANGNQ